MGLTGLGGKDAHEPGEQRVDGAQHFGVAAGHAGGDAPLQGLEVGQHARRLQHRQQEAEDLQPRADVGEVGLCRLLLEDRTSGRRERVKAQRVKASVQC